MWGEVQFEVTKGLGNLIAVASYFTRKSLIFQIGCFTIAHHIYFFHLSFLLSCCTSA